MSVGRFQLLLRPTNLCYQQEDLGNGPICETGRVTMDDRHRDDERRDDRHRDDGQIRRETPHQP